MVNQALIDPNSIVVIGASDNTEKPGGKILKNLLDAGYNGKLYVTSPKQSVVQGIQCHQTLTSLPPKIDLAVLAIPAIDCPRMVDELARQHGTRAFIVISAGFSEEGEHGRELEAQMAKAVNDVDGCLIGPNCVGIITPRHSSVFTTPVPKPTCNGADLISASGATAVFMMETGLKMGLKFNHVFSVGNSAQTHIEDVLAYLDEQYAPATHSRVKLLYFESIKDPAKLLKHAKSLALKGCRIAAIKAGTSIAGSRAAMSHTGSLAGNDQAVDALFHKAGIIRCESRQEMAHVAALLLHAPNFGTKPAIITHAGGPAVMLTDVLEKGGFTIPHIKGDAAEKLLGQLHNGASTANPIDLLATGSSEQLALAIDACENEFNDVDSMVVIHGSAGLFPVTAIYNVIHQKMAVCKKTIVALMPSPLNAATEMEQFRALGHPLFSDEVLLGKALVTIFHAPKPVECSPFEANPHRTIALNQVFHHCNNGFVPQKTVNKLLDDMGIARVKEFAVAEESQLSQAATYLGFPIVAKVSGPIHKSDVGGVITGIQNQEELDGAYRRLIKINGATSIVLQQQLTGYELFIGAKHEPGYGWLMVFGLGGIFVEIMHDVVYGLCPVTETEALEMMKSLRSYPLFKGLRGQQAINEAAFAKTIEKVSHLLELCPEIVELDINPLIAQDEELFCVDARVKIKKNDAP